LRATTVTYQDGSAGIQSSVGATLNASTSVLGNYDFNGDGKTDIAYFSGSSWFVAFATGTGYGTPVNTGAPDPNYTLVDHVYGGIADGFLAPVSGVWWYYSYNGSAFVGASTGISLDPASLNALADTDGDGRPDLVTLRLDGFLYIRLNTSSGTTPSFGPATQAFNVGFSSNSPYVAIMSTVGAGRKRALDFDGDGRQDIFYFTEVDVNQATIVKYHVLLGRGQVFAAGRVYNDNLGLYGLGDFNSDGCTDVVMATFVDISKCNGSASTSISWGNGTEIPVAVIDWDGDGLSDILVWG